MPDASERYGAFRKKPQEGPALRSLLSGFCRERMVAGIPAPMRSVDCMHRAAATSPFVVSEWWPAFQRRCARSTCRSVDHVLRRRLLPSFGRLRLNRIGRPEVERWFDAYSRTAPGGANNALQLLGQIMNSAVAAGHTDTNPTRGIRKNPRRKLTRFLSGEEIDRLHRTLDRLVEERPSRRGQADIIRLLLLTGCRRGEILRLKWSEVDGPVLRLAETKTGPRQVWLSEAAQAIIAHQPRTASAYVFPSPKCPARPWSSAMGLWYRARKEAGIDDVRLHDLRRTICDTRSQAKPWPGALRYRRWQGCLDIQTRR